jgi:RNA polymerase subunit RPABC4/transcription elongation factor Spt4
MIKKHLQIGIILIIILFIMPSSVLVSGIGLSPAEMRVVDAVGSGVIGSLVIVNSESGTINFILQIQSPSESPNEEEHLRVVCEDCHDTHQKYETVDGICPNCGSKNLTMYERIPNNVLQYLDLRGVDCELIEEEDLYFTNEKFQYNEQCTVEILLDLPNKEEYSNKHWEVHITATTTSDISNLSMGVLAGVQMRLLLDVPPVKSSFVIPMRLNPMIFFYIIVISLVILCLYFLLKKGNLTKETSGSSKKFKIDSNEEKPSSFYIEESGKDNNYKISPSNSKNEPIIIKEKVVDTSKTTFSTSNQNEHFSDIIKEIDKILKSNEKK